jgi:hypothetical protein
MKKTMLFVAAAFMLVGTSAVAENRNQTERSVFNSTFVEMVEINSFCKAIVKGDIETVKKLIELGEDVNQKSSGMTPAIFAARYNKAEILKLLIEKGADIRIKSDQGYSIAKYAEAANAKDALMVINAELRS